MTRRKKTKGRKSPFIRLVGLETAAAVAAGMTCAPAMAAPEASKRNRSNLSRTLRTSCSQITDSTASRCAK